MEDIYLLIQLDQVFIEAGTLRWHFIVGLFQLLLQFIASVTIEYLYIGAILIRKVVIISSSLLDKAINGTRTHISGIARHSTRTDQSSRNRTDPIYATFAVPRKKMY